MTDIVFAPGTTDERVITEDEIYSSQGVQFERTHTGIGTWRASVRPDPEWQNRFFEEVLIRRDDGTVLFRGSLLTIDEQRGSAVTRLSGKGIAYDLQNGEADVTYQNILAHDAIQQYWDNQTAFSATVVEPTPTRTEDDFPVQDADQDNEFNTITSIDQTDPLEVTNDSVRLLQSAFVQEGEDSTFGARKRGDTSYSGGLSTFIPGDDFSASNDTSTLSFTPEYRIPSENVEFRARVEPVDGTGDGISNTGEFEVRIEQGGTVEDTLFSEQLNTNNLTLDWRFQSDDYNGADLSAGTTYDLVIEIITGLDGDAGDELRFDVYAVYDNRFNYTFDNDNGGNDGYLSGPELYPDAFESAFEEAETELNITAARIDSSWDDTSNQQRIQFDATGTYAPTDGTEDNTETVEESVGIPTRTITGRARWSRYGSRTTATPTTGFQGQTLQSWDLQVDGNNLVVFEDRGFEGSHLTNLQRLHESADMRFAVKHETDAKPVLSFQPGDVSRTLPSINKRDESVRRSVDSYFNDVTVRGEIQSFGRLTGREQDFDEKTEYGVQHLDVLRPDLDSQLAVDEAAKSLLEQGLRERVLKGTLVTNPIDVLPGPSYVNPFDDTEDDVPLEEHRFRLAADSVESQLVFNFRADDLRLAEDVGGLRGDVANIGRGI